MSNSSLAAQAVAAGPMTAAPPAFNGLGWLVVFDMAVMTAASVLGAMLVARTITDLWKSRNEAPKWQPVPLPGWLERIVPGCPHCDYPRWLTYWPPRKVWRLFGVLFGTCFTVRCAGEALVLWGWDPVDPIGTAVYLFAKRLVDPFAVLFGIASLALFTLSADGMEEQLSKQPFPIRMWVRLPEMRRAAWILLLSFIAAFGVVATR